MTVFNEEPGESQVPGPGIEQIRTYFRQKDCPFEEADVFYFYYKSLDWKNENGVLLRDWKSAANDWLWNLEN